MEISAFCDILNSEFYIGVPDSQLKALCNYLMDRYGIDSKHHIIAANEGNCVGLAAGYYLATGKFPVVYMQNSGEGNIINPVASLLNDKVYAIPMIFVIGWRGEPGVHDEPQHIFQGEITLKLLDDVEIPYCIVDKNTDASQMQTAMKDFGKLLAQGKCVAFIIKKGALQYGGIVTYRNEYVMKREEIIRHVASVSGDDIVVSTTGKASRELFEIREANGEGHEKDFLTVGSMGHSSSIALGIALQKPDRKIWCIDGDGAALMHMGAMAVIGSQKPKNLVHIVINNEAHETVGGMPTVAVTTDLCKVAEGCGYPSAQCVNNYDALDVALHEAKKSSQLTFIEIKCAIGARDDLGRPTTTPIENKELFMKNLKR